MFNFKSYYFINILLSQEFNENYEQEVGGSSDNQLRERETNENSSNNTVQVEMINF